MREFSRFEWETYSGAEQAQDGREPMITELEKIEYDGRKPHVVVVIADLSGVHIEILWDKYGDTIDSHWLPIDDYDKSVGILAQIELKHEITWPYLAKWGDWLGLSSINDQKKG